MDPTGAEPHMGGCQNYGPFLGTLNIWGRIIIGIQKGTMILTTTHIPSATMPRISSSAEFPPSAVQCAQSADHLISKKEAAADSVMLQSKGDVDTSRFLHMLAVRRSVS